MAFIYSRKTCVYWRQRLIAFTVAKSLAAKKDAYVCNVISRQAVDIMHVCFQNCEVLHAVNIVEI